METLHTTRIRFLSSKTRRKTPKTIYIFLQVFLICTTLIRAQLQSSSDEGGRDSISRSSSPSPTTTSPQQLATGAKPGDDGGNDNSDGGDNGDQGDSNSSNPTPAAPPAPVNAKPINTAPGSSQTSVPPSPKPMDENDSDSGLSRGAIAGIVVASVVIVLSLVVFMVIYFKRLEKGIAEEKRHQREKEARKSMAAQTNLTTERPQDIRSCEV